MTAKPIRILFVEGSEADRAGMERFVRNMALCYELVSVGSAAEAIEQLHSSDYDVAVIDYRFSDGTALDLLQELGDTPAIFLTGTGEEEIAAMVLERGAYDYLMKDAKRNYLVLLPGTIQKVIARKHAESELKQNQAFCKDLLDTVLDIYLCVGEDGKILLANRAGARQLGYSPSELIGMPLTKLIYPGDVERVKEAFFVAATHLNEPQRVEFREVRKDGSMMYVASEIRAQPPVGRQVPVIRMLSRDITAKMNQLLQAKGKAVARPPAAPPAPPKPAAAPAPAPATGVGTFNEEYKGTETLLVVDDQPDQRAIAARMLTKMGYRVITAEGGKAALSLMKETETPEGAGGGSPFELILLDMNLAAGSDGLDVYRQMLKLFPGQKCVLLTGSGETDRVKEALRLGCGRLIDKPYTFQDLGRAVREELDQKS